MSWFWLFLLAVYDNATRWLCFVMRSQHMQPHQLIPMLLKYECRVAYSTYIVVLLVLFCIQLGKVRSDKSKKRFFGSLSYLSQPALQHSVHI